MLDLVVKVCEGLNKQGLHPRYKQLHGLVYLITTEVGQWVIWKNNDKYYWIEREYFN